MNTRYDFTDELNNAEVDRLLSAYATSTKRTLAEFERISNEAYERAIAACDVGHGKAVA